MMSFPLAIYFDTNSLREAGEFLDRGDMPRLLQQARDFEIPLHIPQIVWDERITQLESTVCSRIGAARELNRSVGANVIPLDPLDKQALIRGMLQVQRRIAERFGITIIPTAQADLNRLLACAIKKQPPFKDQDKGFKDAMILESVAAHASRAYNDGRVLVVSKDATLQKGAEYITPKRIDVVAKTLEDSRDFLDQCCNDEKRELLAEEAAIGRRFLEAHIESIFDHVRREQWWPELPSGYQLLGLSWIRCVQGVRPLSIDWVTPTRYFTADCSVGDCVEINFGVNVEFDVTISRWDSRPQRCTSAPELGEAAYSLDNLTLSYPVDREDTITNTVTVHATATVGAESSLNNLCFDPVEEYYVELSGAGDG